MGDGEDAIVRQAEVEIERARVVVRDDAQRAAQFVDGNALKQTSFLSEPVEFADDLSGIATIGIGVAFEGVEFLDDGKGNDDFMLGKHEYGAGIVQQYVGIKYKVLAH